MRNEKGSKNGIIRVGFYAVGNQNTPSTRFRILQYLAPLSEKEFVIHCFMLPVLGKTKFLEIVGIVLQAVVRFVQLLHLKRYDVVLIQKGLTSWRCKGLLKMLLFAKVPYVFDVDDMIYMENPVRLPAYLRWLQDDEEPMQLTRNAQAVIAGNAFLASFIRKHNQSCVIIPTPIDTVEYVPEGNKTSDIVTIGWSGSPSTNRYVNLLIPVLTAMTERCRFRFLIISGSLKYIETKKLDKVKWSFIPWNKDTAVEDLKKIDIGVMPLEDDEWARGKCGLKALQYMALGMPAVCSPVGVNAEIIKDGVNGFLAKTEEEWGSKLEILLLNQSLREQMGQKARRTVVETYSVAANIQKLENLLINTVKSNAKAG